MAKAAKAEIQTEVRKPEARTLLIVWEDGGTPAYTWEGDWTGKEIRQLIHPTSRSGVRVAYLKRNYDVRKELKNG